ncbi:MAG: hypothetical protein JRF61_24000, partial [Deltaproteobacteria bacterium]|nr:hypothetical protein [Deltaproteobacteria bacterium]
ETIDPTGIGTGGTGGGDAAQIVLDGCCDPVQELLVLSDDLALAFAGGDALVADDCFPKTAGVRSFDFSGALERDNKDPNVVGLLLFFSAFGTDGETEFKYVVSGDGTVAINNDKNDDGSDGIFPPEPGENQTVSFSNGLAMDTEGKGKGSKGGNASKACTGVSTEVSADVKVEGCPDGGCSP